MSLEPGVATRESRFRALFIGYFSKSICKPAKFSHKLFCSRGKKLPARDHSVFVSCWAIFYSSLEQVLGGTYIYAYGISSGFFVSGQFPLPMPRMTPNQETLGGLNMKSKTVWIIALVAMPLLAAVFILHA